MKLWIDDVRPAPKGYIWCKSVDEAVNTITWADHDGDSIEIIDIDHDAGDYVSKGGDYIEILNWLEEAGFNYPIHIHSMNSVGVANMRTIIQQNGWKEI